jgi:hypothetical protein
MTQLEEISVSCPYCGETFTTLVDGSAGKQSYIEDCQICCRPIEFHISVNPDDTIQVQVLRDDE